MYLPRNRDETQWRFLCICNKIITNNKIMKALSILSVLLCAACLEAAAQGTTLKFTGRVTDASGKGIPGVVVNDGRQFVKTDRQGSWSLDTDTMVSKFVSISTPANYQLPQAEGLADAFYVSVPIRDNMISYWKSVKKHATTSII